MTFYIMYMNCIELYKMSLDHENVDINCTRRVLQKNILLWMRLSNCMTVGYHVNIPRKINKTKIVYVHPSKENNQQTAKQIFLNF